MKEIIMKKYHYTYEIENTLIPDGLDEPKYYIGVRSCDCLPEEDIKYMGTSTTLSRAMTGGMQIYFKKTILNIFQTRKEAEQHEIDMHAELDVQANPNFYNLQNASLEFKYDSTGRPA